MSALDTAVSGFQHHLLRQIKLLHNPAAAYLSYTGPIDPFFLDHYRNSVENLVEICKEDGSGITKCETTSNIDELNIILNTPGGSVEAVEKMVEINRHHFNKVNFIVPDKAMSAGTIFCMSGDKIYMDYSSSLGPIDPQVKNDNGKWVPALGYLDKYQELIDKSKTNNISEAEFVAFQNIDLAELSRYEQAKNLSIDLLKEWLVTYKFKDWTTHKDNRPVTEAEKIERAKDISIKLMDNKMWGSHSRMISPKTLTTKLKLKIDDYSDNINLRYFLNNYSELITERMHQTNVPIVIDFYGEGEQS